eukprot:CAMPEP_0171970488 /NCGR_PEP_ID=MMETSP0993-20121228/213171_1 /TAXON_ID=483369 /ORGANISM="non described non described, Strain CCMP2098" /LENGTH=68 /DNA_ID=CAMNT_0012620611 /DNA_START=9 /DNA_END=211 /DNA_ORIENTATION=+
MAVACGLQGQLKMVKWLFEVGAAEDICACAEGSYDNLPMRAACQAGNLEAVVWLCSKFVGAAKSATYA